MPARTRLVPAFARRETGDVHELVSMVFWMYYITTSIQQRNTSPSTLERRSRAREKERGCGTYFLLLGGLDQYRVKG